MVAQRRHGIAAATTSQDSAGAEGVGRRTTRLLTVIVARCAEVSARQAQKRPAHGGRRVDRSRCYDVLVLAESTVATATPNMKGPDLPSREGGPALRATVLVEGSLLARCIPSDARDQTVKKKRPVALSREHAGRGVTLDPDAQVR
jgi:hypothetical protein